MLVQDATAEESEAYSLTTQADPVMTAASEEEEEATSAAAVVTTTAAAVVLGTSTTAEVEEVEEAARVAVTKVVGELEVLVAAGTAAAVLVEAATAAVVVGSDVAYGLLVSYHRLFMPKFQVKLTLAESVAQAVSRQLQALDMCFTL